MTKRSATHATFTIEREYPASPARVFRAFADEDAKMAWFASGDGLKRLEREFDFRIGGRERVSGQWPDGKISAFDGYYWDIVPEKRIVYSYDMHVNRARISVSLATVTFEPTRAGTRLTFTEQGVFLDGYDDNGSRERGTRELLEALGRSLG